MPLPVVNLLSPEIHIALIYHHRDSSSLCHATQMGADKSVCPPPAIDFRFLNHLPSLLRLHPSKVPSWESSRPPLAPPKTTSSLLDIGTILLKSLRSVFPSISNAPPTRQSPTSRRPREAGCAVPLFRPYVAKVPWHGGVRAFLSQLFPRYGHYCGPNWSSGKAGGSLLWDRRPIDWLDFCCYCHDIGYDDHDQGKLLKADLAFLQCLERPQMATKGGAHTSLVYRSMCIAGLRYILIPYRMQLLRLEAGPSFTELLSNWTDKLNVFKQILERRSL